MPLERDSGPLPLERDSGPLPLEGDGGPLPCRAKCGPSPLEGALQGGVPYSHRSGREHPMPLERYSGT